MKRIKRLLFIILLLVPFTFVNAAGSVSVSTSKLTVDVGSSSSFTIKASNAAGRIDITSSDTSIATVSSNSQFLDNSSVKIKVNGKKEGTVTITIKLKDIATYDRVPLTGSKKITVTVKKPTPKVMKITKLEVVGYDFDFQESKHEYTINVDPNIKKVYVITGGENYSVTGDKTVNIANVDSFKVVFTNGSDKKEYTIKVNKNTTTTSPIKETTIPTESEPKVETVVKEDKTYMYSTIGLLIICVILGYLLYKVKTSKPKKEEKPIVHIRGVEKKFLFEEEKPTAAESKPQVQVDKPAYADPFAGTAVNPISEAPKKENIIEIQ